MAEKHCKLCVDCIHHGTCFREGNKKAYNGDLDVSACKYYKSAVNFVEVVRCEDCAKDGMTDCPLCYIEKRTLQFINHDAEFFCGFGERKEQE